jgi:hypothetical protein
MANSQRQLIGVYKANGGVLGEVSYFLGHLVGVRECSLCSITHSPVRKKAAFREFEQRLLENHAIGTRLVHMNERDSEELKASEGREPCVLLRNLDGSISMFLDNVELKATNGSVESFEKLVALRLDMYP